jgi:hypothetical protein
MKTVIRAAALLLVLALAACSQKGFDTNLTVEPRPVPGVDWTQYSSWKFGRQGEYVATGHQILDDPAFRKSVGDHTISEMSKLGYSHVNDESATMLLMFHVMVEERFDDVKLNPAYSEFDMAWANVSEDDTWREGTLALLAIDAKTGKQIWGSKAVAELDKEPNMETAKQRFKEVVTKMLADFPAKSK